VKTNARSHLSGPRPRALARAVAAIRRDSVASGTAAISMVEIDREIAVVRSRLQEIDRSILSASSP